MQNFNYRISNAMELKITIGDNIAKALLYDTPTSNAFRKMLPLTITLEDYANTEKIAPLNAPLSTRNAPNGFQPSVGDLTYYAPWGNLALFYNHFSYADGLVALGKVTSGMEYLTTRGAFEVTIELV